MSLSEGTKGKDAWSEHPVSLKITEPRPQTSKWDTRKVSNALDSTAQKVLEFMTNQDAFLQNEKSMASVIGEFSNLIHELDKISAEKPEAHIALRQKVNNCIKMIGLQLESKVQLPENQTTQWVKKTISDLEVENKSQLERLEKSKTLSVGSFQTIYTIATNKSISDNLRQVQVLNQYADTTTSGFENCGYHALKNALIMLIPDRSSEELAEMFKNKEIFLSLYKTYCSPLLAGTAMTKGKLDASVPLLGDILANFSKDQNPPAVLFPLQTALQRALDYNTLAVFQMTTTTGDDRGQPLFGFFDDKGSYEGKKLYDLAKQPGPKTLSCVFGNEGLGHWYTLTIHKSKEGEYQFLGADSMDNNHDILGIFSTLEKMKDLALSQIEKPDQFLKDAFGPMHDFLSPRAGWFEPNGSLQRSYAESLMDRTPVATLASDDAPTGSVLERNVVQCFRVFDFMRDAGWIDSPDYWIQKQLNDLEKLVFFYAENLPEDDPGKAKMKEIVLYIGENKRHNIVEETIEHALSELEKWRGRTTPYKFSQTESAFTCIRTLYRQRRKISMTTDETERINQMNAIEGITGIEQGFTSGKKSGDIEKSLIEKLDILLLTYQDVSRKGEFNKMIEVIGNGDGCLTARMGRVTDFYSELKGMSSFKDFAVAEKIQEAPVTALSEALSTLASEYLDERLKQFITSLDDKADVVSKSLQDYASGDLGMRFREFLINEKIISSDRDGIPDADEIDWKTALPKVLEKKAEVVEFLNSDKDDRFGIEMKGYIMQMTKEKLLGSLDVVTEKFETYAAGTNAAPFRDFLVSKNVTTDSKITDWEPVVLGMSKLDEFNGWLNIAKMEALKFF